MPESYDISASNPSNTAIDSLFVVDWRITVRRLERIFVAPGGAAAVSEYFLPNLFGLYLWKWRKCVSCKAGGSGRRKGRRESCGRHSKVAGSQGLGRQQIIRPWAGAARRGHPVTTFWNTPYQG